MASLTWTACPHSGAGRSCSPVAIYLDASVLRVTLQGPEMSAVRALARAHKQPIFIPSTALDEATANRRRDIEAALNEVQLAIKKASWAFEVPYFNAPAPLALAL